MIHYLTIELYDFNLLKDEAQKAIKSTLIDCTNSV